MKRVLDKKGIKYNNAEKALQQIIAFLLNFEQQVASAKDWAYEIADQLKKFLSSQNRIYLDEAVAMTNDIGDSFDQIKEK